MLPDRNTDSKAIGSGRIGLNECDTADRNKYT